MQASLPLPPDVRLMNTVSAVLWAGLAAALLLGGLAWASRLPLFSIRGIDVEGEVDRNSVATIRANAAPLLAGNFFSLDLARSKQAFETVPWVREANVRRVWPNRLAVHLAEHRPAAFWGDDRLVNLQGQVFDANLGDVEDEDLPTLRGPQGSSALMLSQYRRLEPLLAPLEARIERLTLSGRGSWHARLDNGAQIELGRGSEDEVAARTERFARTLAQVGARYRRPLEYADLRHADGYAVRLQGISTTTTQPAATKPGRRTRTQ